MKTAATTTRRHAHDKYFVVCVDNLGYEASLEQRKIYVAIADSDAKDRDLIRVIDESGEDYLFSKERFAKLDLSEVVRDKIMKSKRLVKLKVGNRRGIGPAKYTGVYSRRRRT
jgi:hypothetical protein